MLGDTEGQVDMVEKDLKGPIDRTHSADKKVINLPLTDESARSLRAGDIVSLSGAVVTGRDRAHKYLFEQRPSKDQIPFDLRGIVLYHCGPVMRKTGEGYKAVAAGPTTSIRVEMYEAALIREYGIRGIMGKGGMGENTIAALKETGSVYFQTVGGAAVLACRPHQEDTDGLETR